MRACRQYSILDFFLFKYDCVTGRAGVSVASDSLARKDHLCSSDLHSECSAVLASEMRTIEAIVGAG